jgi:RHS repeat-associated protein
LLKQNACVLPGGTSATFAYDGDGKRVKGTVNSVTTAYVGNYFEWTSAGNTRYYYHGSMRLAMQRTGYGSNNGLFWLLGDHLGSTAIQASSNGSLSASTRYRPWGEQRAQVSTLLTTFRFTGQRSEEADLGLLFYNARWYDPYLTQFTQPDSMIPSDGGSFSPLVVDYHETKFLEQLNRENRRRLEDPQAKLPVVPTNPLAFNRYSYSYYNPLRYTDPDGHFAFLVPLLAGAVIGSAISTATYAITAQVTGQEITLAGALGAAAGGAVAGAVSVIATPLAGTLLHAAGTATTGTALVAGTAAVNAAGGAASYLAGGFTQNAVDSAMGNIPTFQPTIGGMAVNAAVAGALSPMVGNRFPVANNTMSTLRQSSYFMPGRTVPTLFATQNARNMYSQALVATGTGSLAGYGYSEWEQPR